MKSSASCSTSPVSRARRARFGVLRRTDRRVANQIGGRAQAGMVQLHRGDRALRLDLGRQAEPSPGSIASE